MVSRRSFLAGAGAIAAALSTRPCRAEEAGIQGLAADETRITAVLRGEGRMRLRAFPIQADSRAAGAAVGAPVGTLADTAASGDIAWEGYPRGEARISFDRFSGGQAEFEARVDVEREVAERSSCDQDGTGPPPGPGLS